MEYFTKKEFTGLCILLCFIIIAACVFGVAKISKDYKERRITPEQLADRDEAKRVAGATKRLIDDDDLWASAENEAILLSNTVEENTNLSIYALYRTEEGDVLESIVTAGVFPSVKNQTERETIRYKMHHAITTSTVSKSLRDSKEKHEVVGMILNWEDPDTGRLYSLIDLNADGSWDYMSLGGETHFGESGNISFTDDIGNSIYANANNPHEVIESQITLGEFVKKYGEL